jgi:hypothetical protein
MQALFGIRNRDAARRVGWRLAAASCFAVAVTVAVGTMVATAPGQAEDRLIMPEITITPSPTPSPPDASHQHCVDKNDQSLGCLNEKLRAKVDEVNPTLTTPPIDAKSSDLKVGTVNVPGVQQQYGKNFGKSVIPYRPPPPVYGGIGGRH